MIPSVHREGRFFPYSHVFCTGSLHVYQARETPRGNSVSGTWHRFRRDTDSSLPCQSCCGASWWEQRMNLLRVKELGDDSLCNPTQ